MTCESHLRVSWIGRADINDPDKTDHFTVQIESKQRELEPWTTKINEKQSAIDVAQSERDLLQQKASGAQDALEEARNALENLQSGGQGKQEEHANLQKEATRTKKALKESEVKLEVCVSPHSRYRYQ